MHTNDTLKHCYQKEKVTFGILNKKLSQYPLSSFRISAYWPFQFSARFIATCHYFDHDSACIGFTGVTFNPVDITSV